MNVNPRRTREKESNFDFALLNFVFEFIPFGYLSCVVLGCTTSGGGVSSRVKEISRIDKFVRR